MEGLGSNLVMMVVMAMTIVGVIEIVKFVSYFIIELYIQLYLYYNVV